MHLVLLRSYNRNKLNEMSAGDQCWALPFRDVHKHYYLHQCLRGRRGYARLCSLSFNFAMQSFTLLGLATVLLSPTFVNASKCRPQSKSSAGYAISSASSGVAYPSSSCEINDCLKGKKDVPEDICNACRTKMQ